ncbi:hypothetical protein Cni_G15073 [Canna indica]|uniref:BUB1 N-terminal domain-containing protein n=1 Tax=Canna indica TaxID=4628 RepID=A0AAQ3KIX7_9LILI|nr:hypothetical protein Cni_G15073 [Canna indica]
MADDYQKQLLSSLVSDIKSYDGGDPLRPWLHGIRRMRESLPPPVLKEKLPRFLQKCAQAFESDRRYRNDSRYLRIWIELMDYVDDAKVLLRKMEKNGIGLKRAMFYLAYALYYEKHKKFDEAEKMYHLGVQNLAEPVSELQKSYEEFLQRMELYKKRTAKEAISKKGCLTLKGTKENKEFVENKVPIANAAGTSQKLNRKDTLRHGEMNDSNIVTGHSKIVQDSFSNLNKSKQKIQRSVVKRSLKHGGKSDVDWEKQIPHYADDTVVVKFVGSAIVGRSEAEDACHHGLVDPTINMKEAMNDISSMFREPLEPEIMVKRRSSQNKQKTVQQTDEFKVFVDEDLSERPNLSSLQSKNEQRSINSVKNLHSINQGESFVSEPHKKQREPKSDNPFFGEFKILADDEEEDVAIGSQSEVSKQSSNASICSKQKNPTSNGYGHPKMIAGFNEETIVRRFVGSTVLGEPKVENACHHGLLDPTINLKEAMDDINNMFGEPLDFKGHKPKKQGLVATDKKPPCDGFSIFLDDDLDDDLDDSKGNASTSIPCKFAENADLFEPTIFTKEAMAEINEMFGKPLDF